MSQSLMLAVMRKNVKFVKKFSVQCLGAARKATSSCPVRSDPSMLVCGGTDTQAEVASSAEASVSVSAAMSTPTKPNKDFYKYDNFTYI